MHRRLVQALGGRKVRGHRRRAADTANTPRRPCWPRSGRRFCRAAPGRSLSGRPAMTSRMRRSSRRISDSPPAGRRDAAPMLSDGPGSSVMAVPLPSPAPFPCSFLVRPDFRRRGPQAGRRCPQAGRGGRPIPRPGRRPNAGRAAPVRIFLGDQDAHLDLGRRDHLDVDTLFGQGLEHPLGHAGVAAHADADDRHLDTFAS